MLVKPSEGSGGSLHAISKTFSSVVNMKTDVGPWIHDYVSLDYYACYLQINDKIKYS